MIRGFTLHIFNAGYQDLCMRMEDAGTSEEDDIDSQDSNIRIDHGHLARNCSIKIITPAVKGLSHLS